MPSLILCLTKFLGCRSKLIVSERNTTQKINLRDRIRFFLYRWANMIIPNSYSQADFLSMRYKWMEKKLRTISNFVDLNHFSYSPHSRNQVPLIVIAASIWPPKNTLGFIEALRILSDGDGIAISKRRITLSTSGIAPHIESVASELGVKLAISLHAPNDEKRSQIMPINNRYKIADVLSACQKYQAIMGMSRMITFEYLMLDHFNDTLDDAKELISLMKKYNLGAKFNLIPFNPWPGCDFKPSSNNRVHTFSRTLEAAGYEAPIRVARGQDILAACGQLKSKNS